jgi:hypothetical protein
VLGYHKHPYATYWKYIDIDLAREKRASH